MNSEPDIEDLFTRYKANVTKYKTKGTKAAAKRARKDLLDIKHLTDSLRKSLIIESDDQTKQLDEKISSGSVESAKYIGKTPDIEPVKRGRGRPKKIVVDEPVKRGRGRPKKIVVEE